MLRDRNEKQTLEIEQLFDKLEECAQDKVKIAELQDNLSRLQ